MVVAAGHDVDHVDVAPGEHLLERIAASLGKSRGEYLTMLAKSACLSCDNAHAVHPNYQERHDTKHAPYMHDGRFATLEDVVALLGAWAESIPAGGLVILGDGVDKVGTTSLAWEGGKAVVTFAIPSVPGATATATLDDKYMTERVVVKQGTTTIGSGGPDYVPVSDPQQLWGGSIKVY